MMSSGWGGGGVKKCFLSLRRTALLSAEGKNSVWIVIANIPNLFTNLESAHHFEQISNKFFAD
jgi:hypothetical protein